MVRVHIVGTLYTTKNGSAKQQQHHPSSSRSAQQQLLPVLLEATLPTNFIDQLPPLSMMRDEALLNRILAEEDAAAATGGAVSAAVSLSSAPASELRPASYGGIRPSVHNQSSSSTISSAIATTTQTTIEETKRRVSQQQHRYRPRPRDIVLESSADLWVYLEALNYDCRDPAILELMLGELVEELVERQSQDYRVDRASSSCSSNSIDDDANDDVRVPEEEDIDIDLLVAAARGFSSDNSNNSSNSNSNNSTGDKTTCAAADGDFNARSLLIARIAASALQQPQHQPSVAPSVSTPRSRKRKKSISSGGGGGGGMGLGLAPAAETTETAMLDDATAVTTHQMRVLCEIGLFDGHDHDCAVTSTATIGSDDEVKFVLRQLRTDLTVATLNALSLLYDLLLCIRAPAVVVVPAAVEEDHRVAEGSVTASQMVRNGDVNDVSDAVGCGSRSSDSGSYRGSHSSSRETIYRPPVNNTNNNNNVWDSFSSEQEQALLSRYFKMMMTKAKGAQQHHKKRRR